jgi:hypothetical protein
VIDPTRQREKHSQMASLGSVFCVRGKYGRTTLRGQAKRAQGCEGPQGYDTISDASGSIARYICFDIARGLNHPLTGRRPTRPTATADRGSLKPAAAHLSRAKTLFTQTEPALSDVPTFHVRAQLILSITQQH